MSTEFIGARIINAVDHDFAPDEIAYIETNGTTIAAIRAALGQLPHSSIQEGVSLDALIGEAVMEANQPEGTVDPNVINPADPANEGKPSAGTAAE